MKNLLNVLATLETATLKLSGEKLNQTQRNEFKASLMNALVLDLQELGVDTHRTSEGAIVRVENDTTNIYINFETTIKNLDFDLDGAKQELVEAQNLKSPKSLREKGARNRTFFVA